MKCTEGQDGIPTTVTVTPMLPMYHVQTSFVYTSYRTYDVKHIITATVPSTANSGSNGSNHRSNVLLDSLSKWYHITEIDKRSVGNLHRRSTRHSLRKPSIQACKDRNIKLGIGESGFAPPF